MVDAIAYIVFNIGYVINLIYKHLITRRLPKTIHEEIHIIRTLLEERLSVEVSSN